MVFEFPFVNPYSHEMVRCPGALAHHAPSRTCNCGSQCGKLCCAVLRCSARPVPAPPAHAPFQVSGFSPHSPCLQHMRACTRRPAVCCTATLPAPTRPLQVHTTQPAHTCAVLLAWFRCNAQVFELRISSPSEVSVLSRGDEYRGLKAAGARFLGSEGGPRQGDMEPELMGGNRLYMRVRPGLARRWRGVACSARILWASKRRCGLVSKSRCSWL